MIPIRFPAPAFAVRNALRTLLPGVVVSTKDPGPNPALPFVRVRTDGNFRDSRLDGRGTVRVVVWHEDEGLAADLAAEAEGRLIAYPGDALLRNVTEGTSPLTSDDPETGAPLAFFTVTARLRPTPID